MAWTLPAAQYSSAQAARTGAAQTRDTDLARAQGPGHAPEESTMSNDTQTAVQDGLTSLVKTQLRQKSFSTGSKGFYGQDKIEVGGKRYQAQVTAVLIGSKGNPRLKVQANAEQAQAALVTDLIEKGLAAKEFSSGKTGYRTQGKVQIGGQVFQAQAQAVLLK
jgi:hypothetical protein